MYDLRIVDNFFDRPNDIRNYALSQKFYKRPGNYPGLRTDRVSDINPDLFHQTMQKITSLYHPNESMVYDAVVNFQLIDNKYTKGWIHQDSPKTMPLDVAGVIYLTPDAPVNCGTNLYRVRTPHPVEQTNLTHDEQDKLINDPALYAVRRDQYNVQFEQTDSIGNVYNRCVVYPRSIWHTQAGFFGTTPEDSRLTMVFFIKFTKL
jgi:hypothetical protein